MPTSYPVEFEMDFVERRSRLTTFFRSLLAVPHMLFAAVYGLAFFGVYLVAWFALMFTGRWPAGLYEFAGGFVRYITRLGAYLYLGTDQYPPFNGSPTTRIPFGCTSLRRWRPTAASRSSSARGARSPARGVRRHSDQSSESAGANSASGVTVSILSPYTIRRSRWKKPGARTRWMIMNTMPLPTPRMPIQSGTPSPRNGLL